MCGIVGYINTSGQNLSGVLSRMNASIERRGPDGAGFLEAAHVGLAMRRLAIIDLHTGDQPISNARGDLVIVFNGEIYNYQALRAALQRAGHVFKTSGDTEVIVHLYEEHGLAGLQQLEGMFAFAIWDKRSNEVVLVRDRLGIKPLFYCANDVGLFFGSEIKALLATGLVSRAIDLQAVDEFLTYTNIPAPRTIYSQIRHLEPGTAMFVAADGTTKTTRYWSIPSAKSMSLEPRGEAEWLVDTEKALLNAVESHLVADVSIGAFLSGGVDSGIVVAMAASQLGASLDTFTVGFEESGPGFIDERVYARQLATRYGFRHNEITVASKFDDIAVDIVNAFDQPFADDSVIPSYYVSQVTSQQVKVALSGLGGDELFAGYRRHLGIVMSDRYQRVPKLIRTGLIRPIVNRLPEGAVASDAVDHAKRFVRTSELGTPERYQDIMATLPWNERNALYLPALKNAIDPGATANVMLAPFNSGRGSTLERALRTDLETYLDDDILTLSDRLSMWHSLELRVPFLDHRLVELAAAIPDDLKVRGRTHKYLLKKIAERWLPHEMIYHRKQGFEAPMGRWLRGPLVPYFQSVVNRATVERLGWFSFERIEQLLQEHVRGERKNNKILFSLLMLHLWLRECHPGGADG